MGVLKFNSFLKKMDSLHTHQLVCVCLGLFLVTCNAFASHEGMNFVSVTDLDSRDIWGVV